MKSVFVLVLFCLTIACSEPSKKSPELPQNGPIQLHPLNPHYFLYHGKASALITSAEHYGALINGDFDYEHYLKTLYQEGMNYTRIFTGTYFEIQGESFGIEKNTLAPNPQHIILPWATVVTNLGGKVKYDLSTWNDAYFERLKHLIKVAADNEIIVEITLFSSIYRDEHWDINPQNPDNNINIKEVLDRKNAHTLINGSLIKYQVALVEKLARELNEFDNIIFEIQNEPWSDRTALGYNIQNKEDRTLKDWDMQSHTADAQAMLWQERIASTIVSVEEDLPKKHLIAQNFSNYMLPISNVAENISIINFHYAWPDAIKWNYHYDKVIGSDESGFAGSDDMVYRRQAWKFMLSGGGLFNSLDYSFFPGFEGGTGENNAPGGGSQALREQLRILSEFIHSFELVNLKPDYSSVVKAPGLIPYLMKDNNGNFALYIRSVGIEKASFDLKAENGTYTVQHLNTLNGDYSEPWEVMAEEGVLTISSEIPNGELAFRINRK